MALHPPTACSQKLRARPNAYNVRWCTAGRVRSTVRLPTDSCPWRPLGPWLLAPQQAGGVVRQDQHCTTLNLGFTDPFNPVATFLLAQSPLGELAGPNLEASQGPSGFGPLLPPCCGYLLIVLPLLILV